MFKKRITIYEHEKGLRFVSGRFVAVVEPGQYQYWPRTETYVRLDLRERHHPIGGQEALTKDGATVRISLVLSNKIADPHLYYLSHPVMIEFGLARGAESDVSLHYQTQSSLRQWVMQRTLEEAMSQVLEIAPSILPDIQAAAVKHGIEITGFQVLDFGIAGSLKSANADILKAEMEGKAAMQRARNEASTLRSLINSAKLTQEHPGLMELRILSSGQKPRVTFIVGQPDGKAPISTDE